jgi:hypothetical protein
MICTAYAGVMQPCLEGSLPESLVQQSADGQAELEHLPDIDIRDQSIEHTKDEKRVLHLCQTRAIAPFTVDGRITRDMECLPPLASLGLSAQAEAYKAAVSLFQVEQSQSPTQLAAVMTMALLSDTLLVAGLELFRDACCRPS